MNFINNKILIIVTIFLLSALSEINANTIIFKLKDTIFTSEDLEKRINYIKLKDGIVEINKDKIKNEYINALIFNEFGKKKVTLENSLVEDYYNNFFLQYEKIKKNDLLYKTFTSITYEEILNNLKIDIIRKILLEDLLNNNYKNKILDEVNIEDIYEKYFKYFSFNKKNFDIVEKNNITIDFTNIQRTIDELEINNIQYIYEIKKIFNIKEIAPEIQKSFSNDNEFVELKIGNNKIIGQIIKKIRFENEIKYTLIKLTLTDKDYDYDNLTCEKILNNDNFDYIEIKNLEFSSLNNIIKENLKKINDKIMLNESDKQFIIMLCKINYDENFFKNYKINSQVDLIVNDIENEFIKKYSNIYTLEISNE